MAAFVVVGRLSAVAIGYRLSAIGYRKKIHGPGCHPERSIRAQFANAEPKDPDSYRDDGRRDSTCEAASLVLAVGVSPRFAR
jgi:hypothetical protein